MTGLTVQGNIENPFKPQRVKGERGIVRMLKNLRDCDSTYKKDGDFWVGLFEELNVACHTNLKDTPCSRFFQEMLVNIPMQSGLDAGHVVRSVAGLDDQGKKAVLFYLSELFDKAYPKCRFTDSQCEAVLNKIKVQAFLQNYDHKRLASLSDQEQYDLFMNCLSMAPDTEDVRCGRAHFYEAVRVPAALQDYLERAQENMCDYIDKIKDPKRLAKLLSCMWNFWDFDDNDESKKDLASHIVQLIADTHGIPKPVIGFNEYIGTGLAACEAGKPDTLQSTIRYKFSALKTREDVIYATFHEAAGHAVEDMLARRSHDVAWNTLSGRFQRSYPILHPDSDLRKGALMLAFNDNANHEYGYYFAADECLEKYKVQLNEKFSNMAETQNGKNCIDRLNRLDEAVNILASLKAETTQSLVDDLTRCRAFIKTLADGELKDFVNESMGILRHLLIKVDLCVNSDYRLQYMEVLSDLLVLCSDGAAYASQSFLSKTEDSLECAKYCHDALKNYPVEALRQLADEFGGLEGRNASPDPDLMIMISPDWRPELLPA